MIGKLGIFLAAAAAAVVSYSAVPAPDADAGAQAIGKGLAWLTKQQKPDGSFSQGEYPGLTGMALWALIASGDSDYADNIDAAIGFLKSKAQKNGGIYTLEDGDSGGLGTYNTAVCLTALAAAERKDLTEIILNARTYIAGSQISGDDGPSGGGFGYEQKTHRADLMNSLFAMEAMRRSQSYEDGRPEGQKKADIDWDAALTFAERLHNDPDAGDSAGGFSYCPSDAKAGTEKTEKKVVMRSYGSITYTGLLALIYCELDRTDPRVRSAVDWASRHWSLEENPGMGDKALYFFYNIIGRSLAAAGVDEIPAVNKDENPIRWRKELAEKLASVQREDGSWINSNGRFWENDPVLSTSYALLALEFSTGMTK